MKEYFPSPEEVVFYVQEALETGRWNWSNMPAPERREDEEQELQNPVVAEPEDELDLSEANLTSVSPEILVSQGEQIFADFKKNSSLEDVAAEANLELPQFHRLITLGYNALELTHKRGNTWYGITTDWQLYRYQFLPSINMITVCENVPTSRLQELTMAIALKSGDSTSFSYGKNIKEQQIELLAEGFTIQKDEARYLIENMPNDELLTNYIVKQNQFQW